MDIMRLKWLNSTAFAFPFYNLEWVNARWNGWQISPCIIQGVQPNMSPASIYDFIHANVCMPVQRYQFFEEDRKVMSVSYIYVVVAGGWVTAGQEYLDETGNWGGYVWGSAAGLFRVHGSWKLEKGKGIRGRPAVCMGGKRGRKEGGRHASRKDRGRGVGKIKADVALREME